MGIITSEEFERVEIRVGTIMEVEGFPEAKKPAYKLKIDFGPEIGIKKSSARIIHLYNKKDLIGKQVICVVNFPPRQIGPFMSEVLTTGFILENREVILAVPDKKVPNGLKLA